MSVSQEAWIPQPTQIGTTDVATPPTVATKTSTSALPANNLNDVLALMELNFGDFAESDTSSANVECSARLQAFLDYAGAYAAALKSQNLDDNNTRNYVKAVIPRGNWFVKYQIVVPDWVELEMLGTLVRGSGASLETNNFIPMIVYSHLSSPSRVNLYCQASTVSTQGSGAVFGKSWTIASASITMGGAGYTAGQEFFVKPDASSPFESLSPYKRAKFRVETVSGGAITSVSVVEPGSFSRRPPSSGTSRPTVPDSQVTALGVTPFTQTRTFVPAAGAGTGAKFFVTFDGEFNASPDEKGVFTYNTGPEILAGMLIGQVRVGNAGNLFDETYGGMFGVCLNTYNVDIDRIEVFGGYYGILAKCIDTRANYLNPVSSMVGVVLQGSTFSCPNMILDTCFITFLQILEGSGGVNIRGQTLWPDTNNGEQGGIGPNNAGYAFIVGRSLDTPSTEQYCDGIRLDMGMINSGSATQNANAGIGALFISYIRNSHINIECSNNSATKKIKQHTGYGQGVDGASVLVSGTVDGTTSRAVFPGATVGRADVASGGSLYAVGDIVRLTSTSQINATFQVVTVSSGSVTKVRNIGPGLYATSPATSGVTTSAVSGGGSGLTLNLNVVAAPSSTPCGISIRDGSMGGWFRDFGVCQIFQSGVPNSSTAANKAAPGSQYTNIATGELYLNTGSLATPSWKLVTHS